MVKNSISDRIKITKKRKIKRRTPGLSHNRANKRKIQLIRKKKLRDLNFKIL